MRGLKKQRRIQIIALASYPTFDNRWFEADLGGVPSSDTWRQWVVQLELEPGRHMIESRAYDGDGVAQTEQTAPVAPNGAQGYPRRWVDV